MKIGDVIAYVDRIKPNAFDTADKLIWLNEVEGLVQSEVLMIAIDDMVEYTPETDLSVELLLRSPHDKIYRSYLLAMIDFANEEYDRYANTVEAFNVQFAELSCWYADKYRPADGGMVDNGYYLSAYGIAVKHGYSGTEDEWLATLKGERGNGFEIRGFYESIDALNFAVAMPKIGDAYGIGIAEPYRIYIWDGEKWVDNGMLRGEDGNTPYIGANGNWYIGDADTGVKAQGKDGAQGAPGYTPVKGVDYFDGRDGKDGYTPVKGVDYFDGKDGKDGGDGQPGYTPVKGVDYFDGKDGKDGVSATHTWNGTTLTVTSASGTSSANLKGDAGADGRRGTGILRVTTAPSTYTTSTGGKTPSKRMSISTIKTQSGVSEVLVGDIIEYSSLHYHIYYLDATYAYIDTYQSIQGDDGADGKDGKDGASVTVTNVTTSTADGGINVVTFSDGKTLTVQNGSKGSKGDKGDSYSLSASDKGDIAAMVIESLGGQPIFGYVDENNTIMLNGNLADGTYTLKYEMQNGDVVNIGNMVLDSNVYYSITSTLTNCTISNSAKSIVEGGSYTATITAKDGYELKSLTVTMGGQAVSVSGGNISIASVTGNIVIVAVAEEKAKEPTNFLEYNATNTSDWSIWINNARAGSDGTYRSDTYSAEAGTPVVTNYIAVQNGDVIEFGGFFCTSKNFVIYNASKGVVATGLISALVSSGYLSNLADNKDYTFSATINNANISYIRIGGYIHDAYGNRYFRIKRNGEYL